MKKILMLTTLLSIAPITLAALPKTYQVTGPVVSADQNIIVVEKGKEKWEIARDSSTKMKGGEIKPGAKVTIEYRMTATRVEVKDGKKN